MSTQNLYHVYGLLFRAYELLTGYSAMGFKAGHDSRMVRCPSAFIPEMQHRHKHRDRHPSCNLNPEKNTFFCYACGLKGGLYEFVMLFGKHRDFPEPEPGAKYDPDADPPQRMNDEHGAALWLESATRMGTPRTLKRQPPMKHSKAFTAHMNDERIVAIYPYTDEHGKLLYEIVRIEGTGKNGQRDKRFEFRQPDPSGKFCKKCKKVCGWRHDTRNGCRIVPYHLPDLEKARREKRAVTWWEGERDAEVAKALGLISTSSPFGANFPVRESWKRYFQGVPILLRVPDADEYPGRQKAHEHVHVVDGAAEKTVVADLWPDKNDGHDLTDHVAEQLGLDPRKDDVVEAVLNLTDESRERLSASVRGMLTVAAAHYVPRPIEENKKTA